jgi:hypothetical protein
VPGPPSRRAARRAPPARGAAAPGRPRAGPAGPRPARSERSPSPSGAAASQAGCGAGPGRTRRGRGRGVGRGVGPGPGVGSGCGGRERSTGQPPGGPRGRSGMESTQLERAADTRALPLYRRLLRVPPPGSALAAAPLPHAPGGPSQGLATTRFEHRRMKNESQERPTVGTRKRRGRSSGRSIGSR